MNTYPLSPSRITNLTYAMKTTIVTFENGVEQRSNDRSLPILGFKLYHQLLTVADLKTLADFFTGQYGQTRAFYFYDYRAGITYTVRFNTDKLESIPINAKFSDVEIEVVTC